MKKILFSIFIISFLITSQLSMAQCKSFTKKKCMPELEPFIHNGQLNSVNLFPGESASLAIPFYAGQEYRILACSHKVLGEDVYFEVKNSKDKLIYSSKGKKTTWDFKVSSTQELIIDIFVPTGAKVEGDLAQSGCVSLLVGFKQ